MRILRISALILSVLILSAGGMKADGTDATSDGKNKEFISDSNGGDRAWDKDSFGTNRDGKKFDEGADYSTSLTGKGSTWHTFGFGSTDDVRATTPEPATLLLLGSGLLGFAAFRRRRASSN